MVELVVDIKSENKNYSIFIDSEPIADLKKRILSYCGKEDFLVVFSEKVFKLYGKILDFHRKNVYVLKDGEKEKNLKNYQKIIKRALEMKLTRKSSIIAIGGGVCGDLAGFVAATVLRGIKFIQVPTTLLACTDSSVGGKVAVDTAFGKNLVGSFYQPKVVLINTNFLRTLDEKQFKSGLGEVLKYAIIEKSCKADDDFYLMNFLSEKKDKILAKDCRVLEELIRVCVSLKVSVIEKDEHENDLRRILNFGHTYGHVVEKITNYRKYTHGEAVVAGIKFAMNLGVKMNMIEKNYKFLVDDIISKYSFANVKEFPIKKMLPLMQSDKKATSEGIVFILPCEYAEVKAVCLSSLELLNLQD